MQKQRCNRNTHRGHLDVQQREQRQWTAEEAFVFQWYLAERLTKSRGVGSGTPNENPSFFEHVPSNEFTERNESISIPDIIFLLSQNEGYLLAVIILAIGRLVHLEWW